MDDLVVDDEQFEDEESEDEESDGLEVDGEESETSDAEPPSKDDKRVRDLQSKADKATAEANKLRKELEALKAKPKDAGKEAGDVPPELRQWLNAAQDRVRDQLYGADPRFKEYGIDPALITGGTPEEMKATAAQLKKFVDRVETKVRNKALRDAGFDPEPVASTPQTRRNYAEMDPKDFEEVVRRALSG